jgi:glycosyltransferase involved in cell wall biosynthesis
MNFTAPVHTLLWFWGRRGGGAQYTCALAEGMEAIDSMQFSASVSHRLESLDRLRAAVADTQVVRLDRSIGSLPLLLPGPTSFGKHVRRTGVDVVLHTMVNPLTPYAWPRRSGVPIATVIHDAVPHPGDTAGAFDRANRFAQKHSNLLIAPSESVAEQLRQRSVSVPIETIPLPAHMPFPDLYDPDGFVLFLGRIAQYKGLDLLAQAWPEVTQASPVSLKVVGQSAGEGDSAAISQLRRVGADVQTRWVPDGELQQVLTGARLVVLPYIEASQSGVITLAHQAGIPLLVTNVGGLAKQAGPSALVVQPTVPSISDGLKSLLTSNELIRHLREAALATRLTSETSSVKIGAHMIEALTCLATRGQRTVRR